MIKPDIILTWPTSTDYPFYRYQLTKYRSYFNQIIVCLSNTWQQPDLQRSLISELEKINAIILPAPQIKSQEDWRSIAVNNCLKYVRSEHILFMEQDFIIHSGQFLPTVLGSGGEYIGFRDGNVAENRSHPAFLIVKTEAVFKTELNFAPNYPLDHFATFSKQLDNVLQYTSLQSLGLTEPETFEHLCGLQSNYSILKNKGMPNYRPERLKAYNQQILDMKLHTIPEFLPVIQAAANLEII